MLEHIFPRIIFSSLYFLLFYIVAYITAEPYIDSVARIYLVIGLFLLLILFILPYKLVLYLKTIKQEVKELILILELSFAWLLSGGILLGYSVILGLFSFVVLSWIAWYYVYYVLYDHLNHIDEIKARKPKIKK